MPPQQRQLEEARFFVGRYSPHNKPLEMLIRFFAPDNTVIANSVVTIIAPNGNKYRLRTNAFGEIIFKSSGLGRYYVAIEGYRTQSNSFKLSPSTDKHYREPMISQQHGPPPEVMPDSATAQRRLALRASRSRRSAPPQVAERRQPTVRPKPVKHDFYTEVQPAPTESSASILASYRENKDGTFTIFFRSPGSYTADPQLTSRSPLTIGAGRTVRLRAPDGSIISGVTTEAGRFTFRPSKEGGPYRLISLQGFPRVNPLSVNVPTREQLAYLQEAQLNFEIDKLLSRLKGTIAQVRSNFSGNKQALTALNAIYRYYYAMRTKVTSSSGLRQFDSAIAQGERMARLIAQNHRAAFDTVASNFGDDQSAGSRYWQLLGTSGGTGLYGILHKVIRTGDTSLYTRFISFVRKYVQLSKTLEEKRSILGPQRYAELQYELASLYTTAVRDISKYNDRTVASLERALAV